MADVIVGFQGVLLFVVFKDRVEVLIPNAQRGMRAPDLHEDRPHFAWLTSVNPGTRGPYQVRDSLAGTDIVFGSAATAPDTRPFDGTVFSIAPVIELIGYRLPKRDPLGDPDSEFVTSRITIRGGDFFVKRDEFEDLELTLFDFHNGRNQVFPSSTSTVYWRCPGSRLETGWKLANRSTRQLVLEASNGPYYVSNLDCPTPEGFTPPEEKDPTDRTDIDFRWLYHLYGLPNRDWRPARATHLGFSRPLPVPTVTSGDMLKCLTGTKCRPGFIDYSSLASPDA